MNKEQLLDNFSYLDENLLERSEAPKPRIAWRRWAGIAACVVLIAVLVMPTVQADPKQGVHISLPHLGESWESMVRRFNPTDVVEAEDADKWTAIVENFEPAVIEEVTPNGGTADEDPIGTPAILCLDDGEGNSGTAATPVIPMVESYETGVDACYAAPKNGEVNLSVPLREAMNEYGDNARYRVVVDRFQNEQPLDPAGDEIEAEMDRLAAVGIVNAYERFYDHDVLERAYFTIHASRYELEHFPPSDDYGYMLFLYGERVPDYEPQEPVVFSGGIAVTPPLSDEICGLPPAEEAR